jgi:hypothetical protein
MEWQIKFITPEYRANKRVHPILLFFVFITFIVLSSCSQKAEMSDDYYSNEYNQAVERDKSYSDTSTWADTGEDMDEYEPGVGGMDDGKNNRWDNEKTVQQNDQEEQEEQMKVYFGYLKLQVDNAREVRSEISSLADETGGYVEASYENTIIIRVPKELFSRVLETLMDMGDVLDKAVETYDVTEFYQDLAARLEIAKKTRDRLYNLLEKTTDVKERLKILKEIRRLSEEIENINMTLENIKRLISFSRITIELEQRLADLSHEDKRSIPFPWIATLDPFYKKSPVLRGKITIDTGDEFAVFDNKNYFFAESTSGVRIHITSKKNIPRGDTLFWQKAVEYHLSRYYKETEFLELGQFKGVRFMSKDKNPFYYIVGVYIHKDDIIVSEILFPHQEAYDALGERVKEYITGCTID